MNDNLPPHVLRQQTRRQARQVWAEQLQDLRDIGVRAVANPESLTMGEIQEIAWAFLMAAGMRERHTRTSCFRRSTMFRSAPP